MYGAHRRARGLRRGGLTAILGAGRQSNFLSCSPFILQAIRFRPFIGPFRLVRARLTHDEAVPGRPFMVRRYAKSGAGLVSELKVFCSPMV